MVVARKSEVGWVKENLTGMERVCFEIWRLKAQIQSLLVWDWIEERTRENCGWSCTDSISTPWKPDWDQTVLKLDPKPESSREECRRERSMKWRDGERVIKVETSGREKSVRIWWGCDELLGEPVGIHSYTAAPLSPSIITSHLHNLGLNVYTDIFGLGPDSVC